MIKFIHGSQKECQKKVYTSIYNSQSFCPELISSNDADFRTTFKGICLKQNSVSFLHKNIVNFYIIYKVDAWSKDLNTDFTLRNCLFGEVKIAKKGKGVA